MPTQTRHKSVAKRLHDPHRPGRPPKALTPEKEPKPKTNGMAMSVEDMAEELAIGRSIAYQLIQQPDFPSFMIGRRVLVSRKGLQDWIDRQCTEKLETLMEQTEDTYLYVKISTQKQFVRLVMPVFGSYNKEEYWR